MRKIKILSITVILFSIPYITLCSHEDVFAAKLNKLNRENSRWNRAADNIGDHVVAGATKAGFDLLSSMGQKKIELWFDDSPTTAVRIDRIASMDKLIGDHAKVLVERTTMTEEILNKQIASVKNDKSLSELKKELTIKDLTQQKKDLLDRTASELFQCEKRHNQYSQEIDYLSLKIMSSQQKNISPETENSTPSTDDETKDKPVSPEKNVLPQTDSKNEPKTIEIEEEENNTNQKQGLMAKISSVVMPACAVSFDFIAQNCGPKTAAAWLATHVPFFKDKETIISNTLTATGSALVIIALYKAYTIFTAEENDDDKEKLDIFSENFNINKRS
jgi:hypothetical protein